MTSFSSKPQCSIIIPVYNRPDEVDELLDSLMKQLMHNFEIVIVEDGSSLTCEYICDKYSQHLDIKYFEKPNSGPGLSRNYGAQRASGSYFIFFDSDCVIPSDYMEIVSQQLQSNDIDCYGGPDKAHDSFNDLQKAINYSMTALMTTGGIRGSSEKVDKFYPRSFNMGCSREVYESTGGYSNMRFGEDIDFSLRIEKAGFKLNLIKDAFVYHKRRTSFRQFYKQVINSGIARINLWIKYPGSMKLPHLFPAAYLLGFMGSIVLAILMTPVFLILYGIYSGLIFIESLLRNKSLKIGFLSIITSFIQLIGYGYGFITAFINRIILKKDTYAVYTETFYD